MGKHEIRVALHLFLLNCNIKRLPYITSGLSGENDQQLTNMTTVMAGIPNAPSIVNLNLLLIIILPMAITGTIAGWNSHQVPGKRTLKRRSFDVQSIRAETAIAVETAKAAYGIASPSW